MPLLVIEATTEEVRRTYEQDPSLIVWWGTEVECASALSRRERQEKLPAQAVVQAVAQLEVLKASWHEIQPAEPVRRTALRLLRVHDLRTADALQIAAAIVAAEGHPGRLQVVTLDERMSAAMMKEGFALAPL
ncbi:MAG: type II toxin-antitoxin system VapC family toxin [Actinomycetota bacterium]|nr:type II toxin-antitoxin system VapC family toxin [Actinomycetota bacterium]